MNEISVNVVQVPGEITWNFEEIKSRLSQELEVFKNTVYTDDTIKDAKADAAELRKLKTTLDDRRKEVKGKCLEPYSLIEDQVKQLEKLINEPLEIIGKKVDEYENKRKELALKEINAYYAEKAKVFTDSSIVNRVYKDVYDSRWLNVSTTKKTWKEAIDNEILQVQQDISVIIATESEFKKDMMDSYIKNLRLSEALETLNALEDRKKKILEAEAKRKAEADKKRLMEEGGNKNRAIAEAGYGKKRVTAKSTPQYPTRNAAVLDEVQQPKTEINKNENLATDSIAEDAVSETVSRAKRLAILATDEQYKKIKDYIKFIGAEYREV